MYKPTVVGLIKSIDFWSIVDYQKTAGGWVAARRAGNEVAIALTRLS
jgi:hypothetical protein